MLSLFVCRHKLPVFDRDIFTRTPGQFDQCSFLFAKKKEELGFCPRIQSNTPPFLSSFQCWLLLPLSFPDQDRIKEGEWRRTALYPLHLELQGKMVEFAGWEMPIQYADQGIIASHLHTRFTGKNRNKFLELLVIGDISGLPANYARLSTYTNKDGGIIDDT
ncbi:hypothetical protein HMI54_012069, partial [Coelomomyces lativittatus]